MFLLERLKVSFVFHLWRKTRLEKNEPTVRKIANVMINAKSPRPHSQGGIKKWWGLWQTKTLVPYLKRVDDALRELIQSS